MTPTRMSRRAALALSVASSVTFLATPALAGADLGRRKLVVIVCRGAMDGLSVAPPIGDPAYAALRGPIAIPADQALRLDQDFALHPRLATLHALALAGQARIAPAVALPQRIRSHFEAQDLLETGGDRLYATTTGWLNRALMAMQPAGRATALSVGAQEPLILKGQMQAQSWSPGGRVSGGLARVTEMLGDLYQGDPLLGPALASGLRTEAAVEALGGALPNARDAEGSAVTAGRMMAADGGPAIAVFSLAGFDTHANQGAATGQLADRLGSLDELVDGLRQGLGAAWADTVLVAVTEFGRTARANGTGGTDHGTASTLILAGGALRPGGIVGDWPTLQDGKLFEGRDLAPTLDVRRVLKGVLAEHLGADRRALDEAIFPASRNAPSLTGLVA